jgi:hypothetical protein
MMASLANKYITILDALDYAHRVNAQRPHNINIIYAIGQTLFDKLGNSQEKVYYRNRVREESKPHLPRQKLARDDPGWRPLDFDPVVDEKGYILPKYLVPSGPLIADANNPAERYDGSELQFLKQYEPFPFGVTPFGLAFNYQKRAQVLGSVGNRRHAQLSPVVIDSRPPLALKFWADEELERGRRMEMEAFGKTAPPERWDMELTTASIAPDAAPVDASKIPETLYSYERAARLNRDAYAEFARHIKSPTFGLSINTYDSHMRSVEGLAELSQADYLYLKSASAPPAEQAQLRAAAADHYRKSAVIHRYIALKYFTDHPFNTQALPPGVSVDQLKPEQYPEVLARVQQLVKTLKVPDVQAEDRHEYECYIERAEQRLKRL